MPTERETQWKHHVIFGALPYFSSPMRYIDVHRQNSTSLDVLQERSIGDYGNVDGERLLSDPWVGVTRFTRVSKCLPK